jgi:hypothetical protein
VPLSEDEVEPGQRRRPLRLSATSQSFTCARRGQYAHGCTERCCPSGPPDQWIVDRTDVELSCAAGEASDVASKALLTYMQERSTSA